MKKIIIINLLLFVFTFLNAQLTTSTDAKTIKKMKMIVALQEYPKKATEGDKMMVDSANASLKFAMKNYWNFNEVADYMPFDEAKKFVKENDGYCYITINEGVSRSSVVRDSYRYVSYSERLAIYTNKIKMQTYLPKYEGFMSKTTAVYAVLQANKVLELLYNEEFKSLIGSRKYIKKNGPNIIKKTLLIPKEYVSPKLSEDDIKLAYPYDLDLCDLDKVEKAILEQDSKYAVLFYVPIPLGGKYVHRLYISNAEDGDIYGVADGNKVELDLGIFGSIGGQNKKYLINKRELKQIAKLVD